MKRVLIAEDRPSCRELICAIVEALGYEIMEAEDGKEALEIARREQVDLILLDLQMPEVDGYGVLALLRQTERYRSSPIVALTASAMYGDRERALRAGFSSYIPKPVDLHVLRSEIRRLIGEC
jgi:two-component system cell cycle response regulator DivK